MRKTAVIMTALTFALAVPITAVASRHEHGAMHSEHGGMMAKGSVAHEEVVDGVKATFRIVSMAEMMKGAAMPKGMKETHHIMAEFKDVKSGKPLTTGEVRVKVVGPDKYGQVKDLMGMAGHFGADFDLSRKGKYGVITKFKLKDGNLRSAKFWYLIE